MARQDWGRQLVRDDLKKQLPEEVSPDRLDTPAWERRRERSC